MDNIKYTIVDDDTTSSFSQASSQTFSSPPATKSGSSTLDSFRPEYIDPKNLLRNKPGSKSTPEMPSENSRNTGVATSVNDTSDLERSVRMFVEKNKPKLYILTPCFGSQCFVNYVHCLMNTVEFFRKINLPMKVEFCKNDSLVSRARNNLIARAMSDHGATHFLFIDNDISWDPFDILKLMMSERDLVGGIYPLKMYDWKRLVKDEQNPYNSNVIQTMVQRKNGSQLKDLISDEDMVQYNLLRYNINYLDQYLKIDNNLAEVKHLATGFMMIKRGVIEKMQRAFPSTKYTDDVSFLKPHENAMAYALFDCGVEDGHYYSEDWLFCDRWMKMGGKIWVDVSINLTHTGIEDYRGCYISTII